MSHGDSTLPFRYAERTWRRVRGVATLHGREVAFENKLEADFLESAAWDTDILKIERHAVHITFQGSKFTHCMTPTFCVTRGSTPSVALIEVLHERTLSRHWDQRQDGYRVADLYAKERGWAFTVLTERDIRSAYLDNVRLLRPYRDQTPQPDLDQALIKSVAAGHHSVETVIENALRKPARSAPSRRDIVASLYRLIATGSLHTDLNRPLDRQSILHVTEKRDVQ